MRNMTIIGRDAAGGTATAWVTALQWQFGVDLRGVSGAELSGMTITNTYGDALYVGVGYNNTTWTTNVYAHDNTFAKTGRAGVGITAADGVNLDHNAILQPGLWGVNIKPNGGVTGAKNVRITNNRFTVGGHVEPFVQAVGNSGGGVVSGVTITGNTVHGMTLTTQFKPASTERYSNITLSGNTSDTAGQVSTTMAADASPSSM